MQESLMRVRDKDKYYPILCPWDTKKQQDKKKATF